MTDLRISSRLEKMNEAIPIYGLLADGTIPIVGQKVVVLSKTRPGELVLGEIDYLDRHDPEIRVKLLEEYRKQIDRHGFKRSSCLGCIFTLSPSLKIANKVRHSSWLVRSTDGGTSDYEGKISSLRTIEY